MDMKEIGKVAKELEAEGVDLHELAKQALKDDKIVKIAIGMLTDNQAYAIALSPIESINN